MSTITHAQRQLLAKLAASESGQGPATHHKTVAALMEKGLIESSPGGDDAAGVKITDAGRALLNPAAPPESAPSKAPDDSPPPAAEAKPKCKTGTLVDLLRRPEGATIETMMTATGWQAHSVRGALAGAIKKKLSLSVVSEKIDGQRVYRIPAGAAA